jgi:hypothetical protein
VASMGHLAHGGEELLGRFNEDALDFSIEDGGGGTETEHGGEADRRRRPTVQSGGVAT